MSSLLTKIKHALSPGQELTPIQRDKVRKGIVKAIESRLELAGFERSTGGKFFRRTEKWIDVVQVEFLKVDSAPLNSPSVHLGRYLLFVPSDAVSGPVSRKGETLYPDETLCHFRKTVYKSIKQKELKIPNIWFIGSSQDNLDRCIQDVVLAVDTQILPWFEMLGDMRAMLVLLQTGSADVEGKDPNPVKRGTWNFTNFFSRHVVAGLVAFELQEWALAIELLEKVLSDGGVVGKNGMVFPLPDRTVERIKSAAQIARTKIVDAVTDSA